MRERRKAAKMYFTPHLSVLTFYFPGQNANPTAAMMHANAAT
jgi:hypothetical protein